MVIKYSIVAYYPNEYTNSFHHGDEDDKYHYYLSLSKATKESFTIEDCKTSFLFYIGHVPIVNVSSVLSCLNAFLLRLP